jgi:hypothetical protein
MVSNAGYQFKEEYNEDIFFRFDKNHIKHLNWASLPTASKSIYPAIACHVNEKGISFPSELTISRLCGRTEKVVRKGIAGLKYFPGISIKHYITNTGRRSKKFFIKQPAVDSKRWFPFHKMILESGLWLMLSPAAQAVYPVLRYFAFFDLDCYLEHEECDETEFDVVYPNRIWDLCEAEKKIIADHAGISMRSVWRALKNLEDNYLIERHDKHSWRVMIRPKRYHPRSYLNSLYLRAKN